MDLTGVLVLVGFFVVFAAIIYYSIRSAGRQKEQLRTQAASIGYTPLDQPDPALAQRLIRLHTYRGKTGSHKLRNVFTRSTFDGTFYLYDVWDTGSDSDTATEIHAVALQVSGMNLPRVTLVPKVPGDLKMGAFANKVVTWAMTKVGAPQVTFPEHPALDQHFFVTGEDAEAIRRLMTPALVSFLIGQKSAALSAEGDLAAVTRSHVGIITEKQQRQDLPAWVSTAQSYLNGFIRLVH